MLMGVSPSELNGNQSLGTYSMDGLTPVPFVIPGHGSSTEYNQILFQTSDVSPGPHTLTVTYKGNSNQAPLVLDSLYVTNGSHPSPAFLANSSLSLSATPSSSTGTTAPFPTSGDCSQITQGGPFGGGRGPPFGPNATSWPSGASIPAGIPPWVLQCFASPTSPSATSPTTAPSSAIANSTSSSKSTPTGAIVGGVLGGVALLAALLMLVWWLARRRYSMTYDPPDFAAVEGAPQPYTKFPLPVVEITEVSPQTFTAGSPDQSLRTTTLPTTSLSTSKQGTTFSAMSTSTSPPPASSHPPTSETTQVEPRVVHHEDSGMRLPDGLVIDVPPSYTAS